MDPKASEDSPPIFPVTCYIKVIGENNPEMRRRIVGALQSVDIHQDVVAGHTSTGGRYITYNIQLLVQSQEQMTRIDAALRSVEGVKFVL